MPILGRTLWSPNQSKYYRQCKDQLGPSAAISDCVTCTCKQDMEMRLDVYLYFRLVITYKFVHFRTENLQITNMPKIMFTKHGKGRHYSVWWNGWTIRLLNYRH
jgi:hypothetical protein